jgi:hypothetical protein
VEHAWITLDGVHAIDITWRSTVDLQVLRGCGSDQASGEFFGCNGLSTSFHTWPYLFGSCPSERPRHRREPPRRRLINLEYAGSRAREAPNTPYEGFFDKLMHQQFANKPFMRHYLDYYWDIYWDLHLGVTGDAIPFEVRQIGESFNTVLAYRNPLLPITYENYMIVRERLDFLKSWIDDRLADIESGKTKDPERTIAWYWLKNAGDGSHFAKTDVVFECFHNFVALSQWGNSIFEIMSRLSEDDGDPAVRASFQKTMSGNFDNANGAPYSPLELLVMELFRVISPNGGSISAIKDARTSAYGASPQQKFGVPLERHNYISTPHTSTGMDPVHWNDPNAFDPTRYLGVPTSAQINEDKCRQIGLARCPFDITNFEVKDGRKVNVTNSGFGTLFGVADGKSLPVCDYAGFAPFGFGYRRCPANS